jgi:hypothetical protein
LLLNELQAKRLSNKLRRRATTERGKEAFPGMPLKTVAECPACARSSDSSAFLKVRFDSFLLFKPV